MKILITGGAGFIGSHLCRRLLDGNEITVLDNLHTGRVSNIAGSKWIRFEFGNAGRIGSLDEKWDAIFHQGIYSSSPMYKENPILTASAVEEWIAVLEHARKTDCRIVWASTSSVYNGQEPPHKEDMGVDVTDFYTEARHSMERLSKLYFDLYGVESIGLRYFSVYGPAEESKGKYANLVSQFLWALQEDNAPVVYGDGEQTRDFTYVDDVVEANICAMNSGTRHGIFNVGTGKSTSINRMIELLNEMLGKGISPIYKENPIRNYVQHTLADTTKAEKELKFRANITLKEGIGRLVSQSSRL